MGEWVRVVVEVRHVEEIPSSREPDIESQRPRAVDPRVGKQRFGVLEERPQPNLVWIVGLVPRSQPRRDPQLLAGAFGAGVPAHRGRCGALLRVQRFGRQVVADRRIVRAVLTNQFDLHCVHFGVGGGVRFPQNLFAYGQVEAVLSKVGSYALLGARATEVGNRAGQVHADVDLPVRVSDFVDLFVAPRHAARLTADTDRQHRPASRGRLNTN